MTRRSPPFQATRTGPSPRRRRPRGVTHFLWPALILAGYTSCLSDEPRFCDAEGQCSDGEICDLEDRVCRLSDEGEQPVGSAGASPAVPVLPPGGIVDTTPNSGWTEGSFSVSHDGAATYDLPL